MKLYLLFPLTIVLAWICQLWYKNYTKCSTSYIDRTCEAYKKSAIFNDFCHSICIKNDITIKECLPSTTFNKSVFAVIINGCPTILKVNIWWFNQIQNARGSLSQSSEFNLHRYFSHIVSNYFGSNCSNCEELVEKLLVMADSDKDGRTMPMEAIWFGSLLSTQETFMLVSLNDSKSTVNLNSFCGALYSVEQLNISSPYLVDTSKAFTDFWSLPEFAEPIEAFFKDTLSAMRHRYASFQALHEYVYIFIKRLRQDKVPTLKQRLEFVLGTLKILHDLASLKYDQLMWCDIIYDNVGFTNLRDFSSVKLTDLDEVFSLRKASLNARADVEKCTKNEDCFRENYDKRNHGCFPSCLPNGTCSQRPQFSDLALLCENLLFDVLFNPVVMALSEQAISKKIGMNMFWILKDCAKTVWYKNTDEYLANIRAVSEKFRKVKNMVEMKKN